MSEARLAWMAGPLAGTVNVLSGETLTVGREGTNEICLNGSSVSRRHCVIRTQGETHVIEDLGSRHGTVVNGVAKREHVLEDGDQVRIGRSVLLYRASPTPGASSAVSLELDDGDIATLDDTRELSLAESALLQPGQLFHEGDDGTFAQHFEVLRKVSAAIGALHNRDTLATTLLELLFEAVPADRGGLLILKADWEPSEDPAFTSVHSWGRGIGPDQRMRVSRTVTTKVIRTRTAILTNAILDAEDFASAESLTEARVRSVLCVPLALSGRVVGVLYLDSSSDTSGFTETHLELVTAIANVSALPLASADGDQLEISGSTEDEEPEPQRRGRLALALRVDQALHLGTIVQLRSALDVLPARAFPRTVILLDLGHATAEPSTADHVVDRLGCIGAGPEDLILRLSDLPSVAQLAASVAAVLPQEDEQSGADWFKEILLAAGLVSSGATHVLIESEGGARRNDAPFDPVDDLNITRKLAARINKVEAGTCPVICPASGGLGDILSLDGDGLMGPSSKGSILLSDTPKATAKKIRSARTDARTELDPTADLSPAVRNLLLLHHATTGASLSSIWERFAGQGYGVLKGELADAVNAYLEPMRAERERWQAEATRTERHVENAPSLNAKGQELAALLSRPAARRK